MHYTNSLSRTVPCKCQSIDHFTTFIHILYVDFTLFLYNYFHIKVPFLENVLLIIL